MVHGDDEGLVLPPAVAPIQVVIIPIATHKEGVLEEAMKLKDSLKAAGLRVFLDDSDRMPGWKFSEYEMKGVPIRLEIGPRDIANNQCVAVSRDNREKTIVPLEDVAKEIPVLLEALHARMLGRAETFMKERIYDVDNLEDFVKTMEENPGFIRAAWCGSADCEAKIKELTTATSRCLEEDGDTDGSVCVVCGERAQHSVFWGKAY